MERGGGKQSRDEGDETYSVGAVATLRNYLVLPLLVGVGFSLGMAIGYELFDAVKGAVRSAASD
jgi:hypothetical protein